MVWVTWQKRRTLCIFWIIVLVSGYSCYVLLCEFVVSQYLLGCTMGEHKVQQLLVLKLLDQPIWGERVHTRVVGPTPIPADEFSLEKLVDAIKFMLDSKARFPLFNLKALILSFTCIFQQNQE